MEGNKQLDLGGFTLYDSNAIEYCQDKEKLEQKVLSRTVENVEFIFKSLVDAKRQEVAAIDSLP